MTLHITPAMLAAAYEYLRTARPFAGWKLPPADEVEFAVTQHRDRDADHLLDRRLHRIRVSAYSVKTTDDLMRALAHESVHAYQDGVQKSGTRVAHNAQFRRLWSRVCKVHGWDAQVFAL